KGPLLRIPRRLGVRWLRCQWPYHFSLRRVRGAAPGQVGEQRLDLSYQGVQVEGLGNELAEAGHLGTLSVEPMSREKDDRRDASGADQVCRVDEHGPRFPAEAIGDHQVEAEPIEERHRIQYRQ